MKAQSLKNAILQLAVQGKLVAQNPQDEPASELLKKIKAEKTKLIKGKKIKAEKPLTKTTDEEKPFDIPESWEWVRLGELCQYGKNESIDANIIGENSWVLDLEDIEKDTGNLLNRKLRKDMVVSSTKHKFIKGNILYSKLRPYLNKVIVADNDGFCTSEILVLDFGANINARYAQEMLMSPLFVAYATSCSYGVKMPRLGTEDGRKAIIPLPPLVEQQRIVEKIEQLMPLVQQYDSYEKELSALEAKFPNDLKKSVLQFAVQGKLVPQNNADEPASQLLKKIKAEKAKLIKEKKSRAEKPLAQITDEEKPFDIPDSWEWVRLGEIGIAQTGNTPSTNDKENYGNEYPFVSPGDMTNSEIKYINRLSSKGYSKSRIIEENSVIMVCIGGSIGKCNIIDRDIVCNQQINTITPFAIAPKYLLYALRANYFFNFMKKIYGGTATPIVNKSVWCSITIPLPPLAEQQRIVEKVEQILALCDVLADENKLKEHQAPKRLAKVIEFTPVQTEDEHLFAARADEVSLETRTKELERLALLRKKR